MLAGAPILQIHDKEFLKADISRCLKKGKAQQQQQQQQQRAARATSKSKPPLPQASAVQRVMSQS